MKKALLFISVIFISTVALAQSLQIQNATVTVNGNANTPNMEARLKIVNLTSSLKSVMCQKIIIDTIPGSINSFCWGIACYPAETYLSDFPSDIDPNGIDSTFRGDYAPSGNSGISHIKYNFYVDNAPSDAVNLTITYDAKPVGIAEAAEQSHLFAASPNPASSMAIIGYNVAPSSLKNSIVIRNMLGATVREINLTDKQSNLALITSDLVNGVYFYSLVSDSKVISTKKLVVSH